MFTRTPNEKGGGGVYRQKQAKNPQKENIKFNSAQKSKLMAVHNSIVCLTGYLLIDTFQIFLILSYISFMSGDSTDWLVKLHF